MWQVVGQDRIVALLQRSLERGRLAHAYLLVGPPHVGKMTLALDLARALNCEAAEPPCGECVSCQKIANAGHADVQIIGLEQDENASEAKLQAEISIDRIREMQHSASLPPFEGKCKVFIIDGAELLSLEAANCLLKTLEEPVDKVVFILLTANERLVPATVVSRCQRLELGPLPVNEMEAVLSRRWGVEPEKAKLLARLSGGCLGWALSALGNGLLREREEKLDRMLEVIGSDNEERFSYAAQLAAQFAQNRGAVQEELRLWTSWWRDLLLVKIGCRDMVTNVDRESTLEEMADGYSLEQIRRFIASIQAAREQLRQNANPRLVLEVLMLDLPGKEGREQQNLPRRVPVRND
ncbi:MAG TPA: DNA polymerase III subunit [Dehalococcoidia bacterium]|nr:DNA polymerase III subunit [Dehalococcoidia bacterium]